MRNTLAVLLVLVPTWVLAQPPSLRLAAPAGSTTAVEATVTIDSPASGPTEWFAKADQRWLTVDPRTGMTPTKVTIRANPSGLAPGLQRAVLRFVDDAGDDMLVVPVTFAVGQVAPFAAGTAATDSEPVPQLAAPGAAEPVAPVPDAGTALSFASDALPPVTRNLPYSQAIPVKGGKPPYNVRIVDGRLPMGIILNNGALSGVTRFPGTYPLAVTVTDSSSPPQTAARTLVLRVIIIYQGTALSVTPHSLALIASGSQPSDGARVGVTSGTQALEWVVSSDEPWMRLTPARGMAPGVFQVSIDAKSLEPDTYVGTITVTMDGAPNSPMRIPVQVTVRK
ncbi:MAG: putative Ig domain-containing protein [Vicinamibacterales bacterium]|nr:putative Ig domain-containing protein [Vicinamibacterales bacterium]